MGQSGSTSARIRSPSSVAGAGEREGDVGVQALQAPAERRRSRAERRPPSVPPPRRARAGPHAAPRSPARGSPPAPGRRATAAVQRSTPPAASSRETAATRCGQVSQYVVGNGLAGRVVRRLLGDGGPAERAADDDARKRAGLAAELPRDDGAVVHRRSVRRSAPRVRAPPLRDAAHDEEALARLDEPEPPGAADERRAAAGSRRAAPRARACARASSRTSAVRALSERLVSTYALAPAGSRGARAGPRAPSASQRRGGGVSGGEAWADGPSPSRAPFLRRRDRHGGRGTAPAAGRCRGRRHGGTGVSPVKRAERASRRRRP